MVSTTIRSTSSLAILLAVLACRAEPATANQEPVRQAPAPAAIADATEVVAPTDAPGTVDVAIVEADPLAAGGKKTKMTKYDQAVKLLASPSTWCSGAKQLTALKDKRAIVPLVQAFSQHAEADTLCLADALDALGGEAEARTLIVSKDAGERMIAIRLTTLFASDDQLAPLDTVARNDADPKLRAAARDALRQQKQTKKWEEVIAGYLSSADDATRGWAIDLLIAHNGPSTWKRVEDHLASEKNADLRAKIQAALAARSKK